MRIEHEFGEGLQDDHSLPHGQKEQWEALYHYQTIFLSHLHRCVVHL
jgi:hypothetical protein